MLKKTLNFLLLFFLLLIISACNISADSKSTIINLKDRCYWAECDADSTFEEAERMQFHKFSTAGIGNIVRVAGKSQEYVWIRITFTVPQQLKDETLGLLISYLHFADKLWVNGSYVGSYGDFPPKIKSALWGSHFYVIPESLIYQNERNTILIKVYCKGKSGISDKIMLGKYDEIKEIHTFRTFIQSIIYVFAEGGMFFTALLFFMIFIWRKKESAFLSFSLLCISSMLIATPFFAPQLPLTYPNNLPYIPFIKSSLCLGLYLITFFLSNFIIEFVGLKPTRFLRILSISILSVSALLTFAAPTYTFLMAICPFMLALSLIQLVSPIVFIAKSTLTVQGKKDLKILLLTFIPLFISIPADFFIKGFLQKADSPYITLFGWLVTILDFIIIMSLRYNKAVSQNEYLNVKLRREVLKQTRELSRKNIKLEEEIRRAETDLEMASLVQKKFFPYPPKNIRGWDIAVSYSPLSKVSGDMYDYYIEGNNLNGFSLFDVSGHGVAASLITMLAKNIVFQAFVRNLANKESVSRTLYEINDEIIEAKGDIENYLTGLMFRFSDFDENDTCLVEMANAGHPNPIYFSARTNTCQELLCAKDADHHGAIGLDFITVSFPQVNFTMEEDDILLFYTDGLTESRNGKNEMFGKMRIHEILQQSYAKDAQSIMEDIIDTYNAFTKGAKRDDDITVVVMKRENSSNFVEELIGI
ncbi:MAG: SpoIIE family protein phosphatase [Treponema sp.]|uniref:PP2C family protein-serine/threonine phosphatase n=1 Tax=Treponema sp. TaxID=166 RepID=UPI0025E9CEC6|nr:SpoIIE family protein phosphatase [Treponema sp.]MBQ9282194.1 SpoIIE family protein phosphatase [Treponema sp.]